MPDSKTTTHIKQNHKKGTRKSKFFHLIHKIVNHHFRHLRILHITALKKNTPAVQRIVFIKKK